MPEHNNITDLPIELSPAEIALITRINETWSREQAVTKLKADLQAAVEVELATIPLYLYTYYSIYRNKQSGEDMRPEDLFANKAGAMIMSVAVEEMLHMSLSANILYALGQMPELYQKAPQSYPTTLPNHNPVGPVGPDGSRREIFPLGKLSFEQLWHFLQIEYPEKPGSSISDTNWNTIGEFYTYIRCIICSKWIRDDDFKQGHKADQIQSFNYSPNNIDTVSPKGAFDPWKAAPPSKQPTWAASDKSPSAAAMALFHNEEDSFKDDPKQGDETQLIAIASRMDAIIAMETISYQGEGYAKQGEAEASYDDPSKTEESHYYKFLELQAHYADYKDSSEELAPFPAPPEMIDTPFTDKDLMAAGVVIDFPANPTIAHYQGKQKTYAQFLNALFQYMLIMTETMYKVGPDPKVQRRFFNEGLHRSMIWVMDKVIQDMRWQTVEGTKDVPLAPTFEPYDLGHRAEAFNNLRSIGLKVMAEYGYDSAQASLVRTALFAEDMGGDGQKHSMHLPDVSPYWADTVTQSAPKEAAPAVATPYPYKDEPKFLTQPEMAAMQESQPGLGIPVQGMPLHSCMGLNACAGADRFGRSGPPGGQPNDCAGQGYCSSAVDHTCHVQNSCKGQGGCGLYGTGEEMAKPGTNECRALGSCATPINAERFATNGPARGKSVWQQARKAFEDRWPQMRDELLEKQKAGEIPADQPLPETLKTPPKAFEDTGPSYLWISDDNKERGNMTSCGASGMSGAGGCG